MSAGDAWRIEGFGARGGFGARPALVVVDLSRGFTEPASPLACELDDVLAAVGELLAAFRAARLPVVYTTVAFTPADRATTAAAYLRKVPAMDLLEAGSRWAEIDPRVAPADGEPVLRKLFPSAFFGTPLASLLASERCDTVVVAGASTSGCVRATAVDVLQHGYRPVVVREAVGDRNAPAHEASLNDVDAKYGDVIPLAQALAHVSARDRG